MRLARGSGVDGLSGMAARREAGGIVWLRPLLQVRRGALRDALMRRGAGWVEDPTNDDPSYDRVKARAALAALAPLGIDADGLAETADRMARARRALERASQDVARRATRIEAGEVVFDRAALAAAPHEIALRLLAHALRWVASAEYRPRLAPLADALAAALDGERRTLAGCLIAGGGGAVRIGREYQAVRDLRCAPDAPWDGRWRFSGPDSGGLTLAALGDAGLDGCPGWRATGLKRATLRTLPAVWHGADLVAAPLAGRPAGWQARPVRAPDAFIATILSH